VIARAGIQLPFSCIGFFCFTPGCRRIKTKTTGRDGSAINKEAKYTPRMNTNRYNDDDGEVIKGRRGLEKKRRCKRSEVRDDDC